MASTDKKTGYLTEFKLVRYESIIHALYINTAFSTYDVLDSLLTNKIILNIIQLHKISLCNDFIIFYKLGDENCMFLPIYSLYVILMLFIVILLLLLIFITFIINSNIKKLLQTKKEEPDK
jgi:uncharacterized membrane protein